MNRITLADARAVETPAATMRTYASPTTEPAWDLAMWRTEMAAGAAGPVHAIDTRHTVVVVEGALTCRIDDDDVTAGPGDCVVLPAGASRQLTAGPAGAVTVTFAHPGSRATVADGEPVTVPWAN